MHEWARRFIIDLAGAPCAFFLALRDNGTVRRVYVAQPEQPFTPEQKASLADTHPRWLLYSPYIEEGSAYLEWLGVDRALAERWLGRRLGVEDFLDVRATGNREGWPDSWRVIIA